MNTKLFLSLIAGITLVVVLILNSFLDHTSQLPTVLSAALLAMVYVISGFFMTNWAFGRPMKMFLTVVMGGIGIRLLITAVVLVVVIKVLQMDAAVFLVTFGILYILFQVVEVYFINKGIQQRKLVKS